VESIKEDNSQITENNKENVSGKNAVNGIYAVTFTTSL